MILLIHMLLSLIILLLENFNSTNAIKIPIIYSTSPESPLYVKNLTRQQRIKHLLHHSISRSQTHSPPSNINSTILSQLSHREILINRESLLLLRVGVGTFDAPISYKPFYLHMDTGAQLMWLQCEDCQYAPNNCFGNPPSFFEDSESSSYVPIPCDSHPLCYRGECAHKVHSEIEYCAYHETYGDSTQVSGILSFETFTFGIGSRFEDPDEDVTFHLFFGCNNRYIGQPAGGEDIGLISLGWGPRSFITQIKREIRDIFSYCFPLDDGTASGAVGYLTLGPDEGDSLREFSAITLRRYGTNSHYYLNLGAISVGDTLLSIDPRSFVRANDNGGTFIDSGAFFTNLFKEAHDELIEALVHHFSSVGNFERDEAAEREYPFDLCYKDLTHGHGQFPSVTFHFTNGVDWVIKPENVIVSLDNPFSRFCLAMHSSNRAHTIIGAYQQTNMKFIYDRKRMLLFFKPENCRQ